MSEEPGTSTATSGGRARLHVEKVAAPLRSQVVEALREAIMDFHLRPGDRLIERELVEELGVSRATVREALQQLATEKLIEVTPQRGAVVIAPTPGQAADLYEVRIALETLAARLFIERASDEHVAALRDAVSDVAELVRGSYDVLDLLGARDRWYAVLLDGAQNNALSSSLVALHARVRLMRASSLAQPGRAARTVAQLDAIVEAVEQRDVQRAVGLFTHYIESAAEAGLAALAETAPRVETGSR